jgi:hypothetical protein
METMSLSNIFRKGLQMVRRDRFRILVLSLSIIVVAIIIILIEALGFLEVRKVNSIFNLFLLLTGLGSLIFLSLWGYKHNKMTALIKSKQLLFSFGFLLCCLGWSFYRHRPVLGNIFMGTGSSILASLIFFNLIEELIENYYSIIDVD